MCIPGEGQDGSLSMKQVIIGDTVSILQGLGRAHNPAISSPSGTWAELESLSSRSHHAVSMQDNSMKYCHFQRPQGIEESSQDQPLPFCFTVISYLGVKVRLLPDR